MNKRPDNTTHNAAEKTAVLEMVTYLNFDVKANGITDPDEIPTINDIIREAERNGRNTDKHQTEYLNVLRSYRDQNSDFGQIQLTNQSTELDLSLGIKIDSNAFKGYVFKDPGNGQNYVAFSGTPKYSWLVNAELFGPAQANTYYTYDRDANGNLIANEGLTLRKTEYVTPVQANALNYFNYVAKLNNWSNENHITITGHSQGDNSARFVTLKSSLVTECYGFDGPGFSPEAIGPLMADPTYADRVQKITCFHNDNNGVNAFGRDLPGSTTYYQQGQSNLNLLNGVIDHHFYTQFKKDVNGNYVFAPYANGPGYVHNLVYQYSERLMGMNPEERLIIGRGVMHIIQNNFFGHGPENVWGESAGGWEIALGGASLGILIGGIPGAAVTTALPLLVIAGCLIIIYGPIVIPVIVLAALTTWLVTIVMENWDEICKFFSDKGAALMVFLNNAKEWFRELTDKGYKYAKENTAFTVDTGKLREDGNALNAVCGALNRIREDLEIMNRKNSQNDTGHHNPIPRALTLLAESINIGKHCVNYLYGTADSFEAVEKELMAKFDEFKL
jgi:hypothetical protein